MATPKSEEKKKSAPAKRPALNLKKNKKLIKPKPPPKKMVKKPVKAPIKTAAPAKPPSPKDEKGATKKLLLDMRDKLVAEISENRIAESLMTPSDIGDLVDQAGDERDRELSLLLTGREKEKVLAINEALEKLDEETYGTCEDCGEKIGQGRLKVMPLAKLCVSCQSRWEKEMSIQKRTEEDLTYRSLAYSAGLEEEET